jgi:hypothetical protein
LASAVGWFVGFLMGFVLAHVPGDLIAGALGDWLAYSVLGSGLGIGVGILQWLVLRRRVSRAGWWVLASTAGFVVAWVGSEAAVDALGYSEDFIGRGVLTRLLQDFIGGAMLGPGVGLMQWLVLRRQVSRAGWWVLASTVGCGLGMAVMGAFEVVVGSIGTGFLLGLLFGGAVLGAVTGGALVWLLRQPVPEA